MKVQIIQADGYYGHFSCPEVGHIKRGLQYYDHLCLAPCGHIKRVPVHQWLLISFPINTAIHPPSIVICIVKSASRIHTIRFKRPFSSSMSRFKRFLSIVGGPNLCTAARHDKTFLNSNTLSNVLKLLKRGQFWVPGFASEETFGSWLASHNSGCENNCDIVCQQRERLLLNR